MSKRKEEQKTGRAQQMAKAKGPKRRVREEDWSTGSSEESFSFSEEQELERRSRRLPGATPMIPLTTHVYSKTRRKIRKGELLNLSTLVG